MEGKEMEIVTKMILISKTIVIVVNEMVPEMIMAEEKVMIMLLINLIIPSWKMFLNLSKFLQRKVNPTPIILKYTER